MQENDFQIYNVGDRVILRPDISCNTHYTNVGPRDEDSPYCTALVPSPLSIPYAGCVLTIAFVDHDDNGLVYYTAEETGGKYDPIGGVWYVGGMFSGYADEDVVDHDIPDVRLEELLCL